MLCRRDLRSSMDPTEPTPLLATVPFTQWWLRNIKHWDWLIFHWKISQTNTKVTQLKTGWGTEGHWESGWVRFSELRVRFWFMPSSCSWVKSACECVFSEPVTDDRKCVCYERSCTDRIKSYRVIPTLHMSCDIRALYYEPELQNTSIQSYTQTSDAATLDCSKFGLSFAWASHSTLTAC